MQEMQRDCFSGMPKESGFFFSCFFLTWAFLSSFVSFLAVYSIKLERTLNKLFLFFMCIFLTNWSKNPVVVSRRHDSSWGLSGCCFPHQFPLPLALYLLGSDPPWDNWVCSRLFRMVFFHPAFYTFSLPISCAFISSCARLFPVNRTDTLSPELLVLMRKSMPSTFWHRGAQTNWMLTASRSGGRIRCEIEPGGFPTLAASLGLSWSPNTEPLHVVQLCESCVPCGALGFVSAMSLLPLQFCMCWVQLDVVHYLFIDFFWR